MKKTVLMAALWLACLGVARAEEEVTEEVTEEASGAMRAIELAARAAPASVSVVMSMYIKAAGRSEHALHLNSEADYRDPRNVTIDLGPQAEAELKRTLGEDLHTLLPGKRIKVRGKLHRMTVWFFQNGEKTDKYYYQTHVWVGSGEQILAVK